VSDQSERTERTNQSARINTPFTNEHFAAFVQKMIGMPYWFGTCLYRCTNSVLSSKTVQYPSHYGASRTAQYKEDIAAMLVAADCIGAVKGYAWTGGGIGVLESVGTGAAYTSKYGANNCPDKGANSMFTYAKSKSMDWGTIDTLPEVVGLALHTEGHVGYYIGEGYAVEWRGFKYGCVKTRVKDRSWKYWYQLPFIDYGESSGTGDVSKPSSGQSTDNTPSTIILGTRLLKNGMSGSDVKALQDALMQLGYHLPKYGADGAFGLETEAAVRALQINSGLQIDGKYGEKTHLALMDALGDDEGDDAELGDGTEAKPGDSTPTTEPLTDAEEPIAPQPSDELSPDTPSADTPSSDVPPPQVFITTASGSKVNIREGNGTSYARITTVPSGTTFEYIATASNGWHAVIVGAKVGWVSGQYSQVVWG
jgi:peptidoglycan hydrolase-like protein with peptidoglycan-binding domain